MSLKDRSAQEGDLGRGWETFFQIVIAYSITTYFVELQFGKSDNSLQGPAFFLWSERAVATIFTVEFVVRWIRSRRGLAYLASPMAVIDLLAVAPFYVGFLANAHILSKPIIDLRTLRLIRMLRALRLFKVYRYNHAMQSFASSFRQVKYEMHMLGVVCVVIVVMSSAAVFQFESLENSTMFATYSDALWWSVATLTTIGYGDTYPKTGAGRIVAVMTVLVGLGVFGTFVSVVGSAFVKNLKKRNGSPGSPDPDDSERRPLGPENLPDEAQARSLLKPAVGAAPRPRSSARPPSRVPARVPAHSIGLHRRGPALPLHTSTAWSRARREPLGPWSCFVGTERAVLTSFSSSSGKVAFGVVSLPRRRTVGSRPRPA
jgi:voltage-gated potassium channel